MTVAHLSIHAYRHQRIAAAPFAEFVVARVKTGSKRIGDGQVHAEITAGNYLVVAPGTLLNVENLPPADGPYTSTCLCISHELLRQQLSTAEPSTKRWTTLAPGRALDQAYAHTEQGLRDGLPDTLLRHRVRELLEALALSGFAPAMQAELRVSERVRLLLAAAPSHDWRAEPIAQKLAMSVATLRRRLAAEQSSFRAILEEVRLTYALSLIQSTTQPLKSIAISSGYLSPSRFASRFRERFGTLPSALRD